MAKRSIVIHDFYSYKLYNSRHVLREYTICFLFVLYIYNILFLVFVLLPQCQAFLSRRWKFISWQRKCWIAKKLFFPFLGNAAVVFNQVSDLCKNLFLYWKIGLLVVATILLIRHRIFKNSKKLSVIVKLLYFVYYLFLTTIIDKKQMKGNHSLLLIEKKIIHRVSQICLNHYTFFFQIFTPSFLNAISILFLSLAVQLKYEISLNSSNLTFTSFSHCFLFGILTFSLTLIYLIVLVFFFNLLFLFFTFAHYILNKLFAIVSLSRQHCT